MTEKAKTGPKPKPRAIRRHHAVLVRFNDAEIALLKLKASTFPLATYMRQKALAS